MEKQNLNQIKEDPNLITVFICFLRSGLRFTRFDTNNVGLVFIEEIKKVNPNFKPKKVEQRERDQIHIVNAYPKEFEQLIMSLIEEYRIKHKLEYRLKKPKANRGGYNRGGSNRTQRSSYGQSSGFRRNDGTAPRPSGQEGGFRPRRTYDNRQGTPRPTDTDSTSRDGSQRVRGYRPRRPLDNGQSNNSTGRISSSRDSEDPSKRPRRPRRDMDE